jgi:hypothetical protein
MGRFVEKCHGPKEEPEFDEVAACLLPEVVEAETVIPDFVELADPHSDHRDEAQNRDSGEPGRVDEFHERLEPGQIIVSIRPAMQGDFADIRKRKASALMPVAISAELLLECDVLL